jgi:hypothetical protein
MVAPQTRRISRGKGHSYELDGRRVDGVTKTLDNGFPKPALINWAANVVADCVMDRWDELLELAPSARDKILRRARWDYLDEASQRGRDAHTLIQRLTRGEEVTPSEELIGYIDAYLQFVKEWEPSELQVELPVFSREFGYAGTLDVIAHLADGNTWLLDWKTGGRGPFSEHVLQLAAYRYADFYLDEDGSEQPLPAIERTGFVWIRDGSYDLIPADADAEAFAVFGAVQQVAAYRADEHMGEVLEPPVKEVAA